MKMLFYIIGGLVCVGLIIAAMYTAMTIGLSVYIAHQARAQMLAYAAKQQASEDQQMRQSIAALGENSSPDVLKQHDEDEMAGKLPSLFADPEGYGTEDNWLATQISREIAQMAFFAAQPGVPLPDLKVKARVDSTQTPVQVHVELDGWAPGATANDLTPAFAWDPNGYAPLARQLVGTTAGMASDPELADNDVLANLLELTGSKLANEDVQISANLQVHPASWQDHEAAALLLAAFALRNEDSLYADNRPLLCKATAHLALAEAWRGDARATWAGLIAGAAIRTLSGREVDALAHLDNLSAQPDLPDAGRTWIAALRVRATQDWRKADVTEKSPLLLKIVWFRIVTQDFVGDTSQARLLDIVPQPEPDPTLPPDQQKTNPETLITDWSRMYGASPFYDESDDSVKNAQYKLDLEFHELDEVLKIENTAPFDLNHLDTVFAEGQGDSVAQDESGKTVLRVIGAGGFKAISLGHIFDGMISKDIAGDTNQDPAQAENLFAKMESLFHGVPGYDLARLDRGFLESAEMQKEYADWEAAKKTWRLWQVPYGMAVGMPGEALLKSFYRNAVPFGTVYQADYGHRMGDIRNVDPYPLVPYDTPELEALKKLPPSKAIDAINEYNRKSREKQAAIAPRSPQPFEVKLLELDPDNYLLATDYVPDDKLLPVAARFMDYNLNPIVRIEDLDPAHLGDADREMVMRKHVALVPSWGISMGDYLRKHGKEDEAADFDRKALANDPTLDPDFAFALVEYDLANGHADEALALAQRAIKDSTSESGLIMYGDVLENMGKLDEAAANAQKITALYDDTSAEIFLYAGHPDHFSSLNAAENKRIFSNGLQKIDPAALSGAPTMGTKFDVGDDRDPRIDWKIEATHLRRNDILVGLDGYQIKTAMQFFYVAGLSRNATMDFIVWRDGKYMEVKAVVPNRRFDVTIGQVQEPASK